MENQLLKALSTCVEVRVYILPQPDIKMLKWWMVPGHELFDENKFISLCEETGSIMTLDSFISCLTDDELVLSGKLIHYKIVEKNL